MTAYWADYQSDFEAVFYGVRLNTSFELDSGQQTASEAQLLPQAFLDAAGSPSPCRLPITPRRIVLYASDVERLILPMPFRGGSAEYKALLAEVQGNALVKAIDIRPERVQPHQVLVFQKRF